MLEINLSHQFLLFVILLFTYNFCSTYKSFYFEYKIEAWFYFIIGNKWCLYYILNNTPFSPVICYGILFVYSILSFIEVFLYTPLWPISLLVNSSAISCGDILYGFSIWQCILLFFIVFLTFSPIWDKWTLEFLFQNKKGRSF